MTRFFAIVTLAFALACGAPPEPDAPAAETGPVLLVSQKGASSVAWYSLDGELLAEVPVNEHPHEIVLSPDGRWLYTTDNGTMAIEIAGEGGNKVSIVDVVNRTKAGEVDLGRWHRPHGIALCADGKLLVTSENPDQLLVIDTVARAIVKEYGTGGETPHIVKCSPDSVTAYVSNARSRTVAFIDLETGEFELLETGARPEGSTLSHDGSQLYVVHRDEDKIAVIDTQERRVLGEFPTGKNPVRVGVTGDGKELIYALLGEDKAGVASLDEMREVAQIGLDGSPVSLEMHPDGRRATTCGQDQDVCHVIDVPSRTIAHTVRTKPGAGPDPALLLD